MIHDKYVLCTAFSTCLHLSSSRKLTWLTILVIKVTILWYTMILWYTIQFHDKYVRYTVLSIWNCLHLSSSRKLLWLTILVIKVTILWYTMILWYTIQFHDKYVRYTALSICLHLSSSRKLLWLTILVIKVTLSLFVKSLQESMCPYYVRCLYFQLVLKCLHCQYMQVSENLWST